MIVLLVCPDGASAVLSLQKGWSGSPVVSSRVVHMAQMLFMSRDVSV